MITSGALREGDLAVDLGLSRSSLREAVEFHRRIVACAGNSVLSSLLESMSGPTTRARVWRGFTQTGARERTLAEHRAILDALAAHDPEAARSWATVHVAGVEQWLASVP